MITNVYIAMWDFCSSSSEQDSPPPSSVKEEIICQRDLEESISEELPMPEGSVLKGDSSISLDDKGLCRSREEPYMVCVY